MMGIAVAAVEGADAGDADCDDGDGGLDGGPDCDVDDVVCWERRSARTRKGSVPYESLAYR